MITNRSVVKEIENAIANLLVDILHENYGENYTYEAFINDAIEIYAFSKADSAKKYSIIRIVIQSEFQQIFIPNIFMPPFLKHHRIGKQLIRIIYEFGQIHSYDVFVSHITDSFKERLLKRGAVLTNKFDVLQIVETTNLLEPEN